MDDKITYRKQEWEHAKRVWCINLRLNVVFVVLFSKHPTSLLVETSYVCNAIAESGTGSISEIAKITVHAESHEFGEVLKQYFDFTNGLRADYEKQLNKKNNATTESN